MNELIISDALQGSDEWLSERAGNVSASNFSVILTSTGKRTTGETRSKYLSQLACERITGEPESSFKSEWMQRGNILEPDARLLFEEKNGLFVIQVGMIYKDEKRTISCSPDGIIAGERIGVEIKCPSGHVHVSYIDNGQLPSTYKQQVQGCMMVTGFDGWHFMSYHPSIKPFFLFVDKDEKYISLLKEAVEEFDTEVESLVEKIRNK